MIEGLSLSNYGIVSSMLLVIGMTGMFLQRQNIIGILMSLELMLLSVSLLFTAAASYWNDVNGYIFVIFILTVAAAETAIGLAILLVYYRRKHNIEVEGAGEMRG